MFDIGWSEMLIVAAIALIVVGPKELPKVLRTLRAGVAKARAMVRDFQSGVDELVREADLGEVREGVENLARDELSGDLDDWTDPTGEFGDTPTIEDKDKAKDTPADGAAPKEPAAAAPEPPAAPAGETAVQQAPAAEADAPARPGTPAKPKPKARKKKTSKAGAKGGKARSSSASSP